MAALWRLTDIGLPSIDDEIALWGDAGRSGDAGAGSRGSAWRAGALKRGAEGPLAIGWDGALPEFPFVKPVDTTAAGDSFNGGYLAARLARRAAARLSRGRPRACVARRAPPRRDHSCADKSGLGAPADP